MTRPTDAASHTPESGGNVAIDPAGASTPRKLFGYDVLHYLGDGAGTRIYAVKDPVTGRSYALKHVVRTTDEDARFVEQMENEYEVSRQLSHPGLRRAVAFKTRKTLLFKTAEAALVMELFDGESLDRKLPRSDAALVACFVDTAKALYALHHAGFVHCDLKPANILCGPTGTIQVIDLGQACPIGTVKKRIQGTPDYLSPEQFELKPVTERTDAFNLGATMYWALCGQKLPTAYTVVLSVETARPRTSLLKPGFQLFSAPVVMS